MAETTTRVQTKVLDSSDPSLPSLVLQVTQMVDTYMLWIGAADGNTNAGNGENAVLNGNLCKDWACAMPPRLPGGLSAATSLFRSANSDIALPMAQRLAKRFQKQIFLSVDIPSGFLSLGQGPRLALEAEKGIVATLKEAEKMLAASR
ncbi:hypothetical protein BDN70DRAFT_802087 [Pholiota conissans]|uniref:Uncharacterized protein n=1 Tax=Pholiota conissans TaxID=109636 RepID=A0A9P6D366_9AGAR|nr:hypothetical protein BDN70DRAFT_802087 [Pholiota conissans]